MRRRSSGLGLVALAATLLLWGGSAARLAAQIERNLPTQEMVFDTAMYGSMKWRNLGPMRGGRSIGVAGSTARPLEYYFSATGGGLWKTTDAGTTWNPVTDGQIGSASVGPVAVCEANPDVVYIGTGETQLRGNIQPGDGLYKSTDAGKDWTHLGLRESRNFARVRIHPTDCNLVYAAAFGQYGAPNPERGIYRSRDGGQNWERVLFRNDSTGGVDISIDPQNPQVIYAALWEAWRVPWGMSSGGPGSGLFKSTDGGTNWTELTRNPGLPQNQLIGKIGVSVSPADPNRVYAIIEADSGGVFRSDDAGATWTRTNTERKLRQRAFYYTRINADTQEKDRVYVLNVGFFRSDDGGEKFDTIIRVPHSDNHDLWIAPNDNQRMVEANDGGGNVSFNGGKSWTEQDYSTAQIYRLATTYHRPYFVCGGQQDNTTVCVPSKGWSHLLAGGGGNRQLFFAAGGCESGYVAPHPTNLDIFYAGCYGGSLDRFDRSTGQERAVNVWPENPMGQSAEDLRERVQWTFPILFSPHDPNVLYTASQHLWRSTNEGQSWERISGDLTRADPRTLGPSGGLITRDQTGVETFATIFTVAPSPHDANLIWTGSDDGLVHLTRDGGRSWQNVTPTDAPEFLKITTVEASPHRPGAAYMVGNRFLLEDFAPYVYHTEDFGQTWTRITRGIPQDEFVRSIREDLQRPGLLFIGTEKGVRVSWDNGRSWQSLSLNLPVVQVSDLTVKDDDLVISTHGRGFYVLDDITPLRQFTAQIVRSRAHLYDPVDLVRGIDQGVTVTYRLQRPVRNLKIEFLDAQGQVIRTFTPEPDTARRGEAAEPGEEAEFGPPRAPRHAPNRAGMNRFVWNLRYPGPTSFPGIIMWAADTTAGPKAPPGSYQVRLTADGRTQTKSFQVRTDPRLTGLDAADLQAQFDMAMRIRNRVSEANEAVLLIRGIKQQIDERIQRANDPAVATAGEALKTRLSAVEEEIYQVRLQSNQDPLNYPIKLNNKLAALMGHIESAEARPTDQSVQVFNELSGQLDQQLTQLNQTLDQDLAQFNEQLRARRLPAVTRTPLQVEGQGQQRQRGR
ncbi:MAG: glycosyl hydrolase [Gemmatimonadetes bacterium]|nr:glycosyl hydrolase [Gemmatimonadota bacterium]MBA4159506.1 glycosyl hydrolase [Gemmatimonadota bacterium]